MGAWCRFHHNCSHPSPTVSDHSLTIHEDCARGVDRLPGVPFTVAGLAIPALHRSHNMGHDVAPATHLRHLRRLSLSVVSLGFALRLLEPAAERRQRILLTALPTVPVARASTEHDRHLYRRGQYVEPVRRRHSDKKSKFILKTTRRCTSHILE